MTDWTPPNPAYPPPKAGEPPLHAAARTGDHAAISRLAAQGADLNATFNIGLDPGAWDCPATPLMVAAGSGDGATAQTVGLLLQLGADPRVVLRDFSAAAFACTGLGWNYRPGGDAQRLQLVLDAGAPLPANPDSANRLVCEVAGAGDSDRLSILLAAGLSAKGHFDAEAERARLKAHNPAATSLRDQFSQMWENLPPDVQQSMEASMRELEASMQAELSSAPWHHAIPLFCAARSGSVACLSALLKAGADVQQRDSSNQTALAYVGSTEAARLLMDAGLRIEEPDRHGMSPLCSALWDGEEGLPRIRALLAAGADVNATHDHGYTVFMTAVGSDRRLETLKLLIAAGANPHAVTEYGYNAFHAAIDVNGEANAEESVRETLTYLRQLGVDIEARNKAGDTPLARAIDRGTGVEVRVLCEIGADPNAVCRLRTCGGDGCADADLPVLFHAAGGSGVHKDIKVEALLKAGADPLATDSQGVTALGHVVARLCAEAGDYEAAYRAFYHGLRELRFPDATIPADRQAMIDAVTPVLRAYVERFAANISINNGYQFARQWREEAITCATRLLAYESWARHRRAPKRME